MEDSEFVKAFENTLQNQNIKQSFSLYHDSKATCSNITSFKAKDVIFNISQQVKAMKAADNIKNIKNRKELKEYKKTHFMPVSMMSSDQPQKPAQTNKFDTQCVSDTQLIDIIEKAEALMNVEKNVNKELKSSIQDVNIPVKANNKEIIPNFNNKDATDFIAIQNDSNYELNKFNEKSISDNHLTLDENRLSEMEDIMGTRNSLDNIFNSNEESPNSPIINNSNPFIMKSTTPSPLIFGLESFEKFEAIAMPVIEEHLETSVTRQIIHTQISSNKLYIKRHTEPILIDRDKSLSPILSVTKKTTDSNIRDSTITKIKNGIFTIEDSILFSSDEENEIKNDVELSLYCALKTSFYNEHDLNEPMYVGFQTASNKSIQICSNSYNKAKSLLDDKVIDVPITKLVEVMDSKEQVINKNIQKEIHENDISMINNNVVDTNSKKSQQNDGEFETLISTSNIICDNDKIWNDSTEAKTVSIPCKDKMETGNSNLNNIVSQDILLSEEIINDVPGLETEHLNIDDNIIKEFETNFLVESDNLKDNEDKSALNISSQSGNKEGFKETKESRCDEFKTANKNKIKLNTHKLDKINDVFKDIDLTDIDVGLDDYKENEVNINVIAPSTSKGYVGFKTASNKSIKISNQALATTKKIFQDIENNHTTFKSNIIDKNTQNFIINRSKTEEMVLKPIYPVNESSKTFSELTNNNNSFLNEKLKHKNITVKETPTFIGFQTANNKRVDVSKEALAKSKKIFQDINEEIVSDNENCTKNINYTFKGFQTANNQAIIISKDALQRSKKIFDDIKECNMNTQCIIENDNVNTTEQFQGFKTASNKPVKVSKESLAKTKNIFQDINFNNGDNLNDADPNIIAYPNNSKKNDFSFQTASNKPVVISNEALDKTKNIFSDVNYMNIDESDNCNVQNKFQGFKTASNKTVKISKEALSKTKHIFQDIEIDGNVKPNSVENEAKTNFGVFKTASSKPVQISEAALLKSKELFKDIGLDKINTKANSNTNYKDFSGFKTASNKDVEVSKEALLKSRKLFDDMNFKKEETINIDINDDIFKKPILDYDNDKVLDKASKTNDNNDMNMEDFINTEVIKDLEETMCTEDFYKENALRNKRSNSPILSCPRAKRRKKFEIPKINKPITIVGNEDTKNSNTIYNFDSNYKTRKQYDLNNLMEIEKQNNCEAEIDPNISKYQFDTLMQFKFGGKRNDIDSDVWSTDKIQRLFTDSVNKRIIPKGWIENHLKLIVWKLLSYEIVFPKIMNNVCTIRNVLNQLKYRYNRELYNVERPALRKVLERDEISSKRMVLCVVGVYIDGCHVNSAANPTQNLELLLTDGWYTIMASTDAMINKLIFDGKISVGTKLVIHGAELLNCEQGVAPWENTSAIRLKIFGNSTRRAKWSARLGFHGNGAILSQLSSVRMEGGKVSRVKVFVARVYPMMYVERFDDGSTVTRSERLENLYQIKYENEKQNELEKLYEEVEKYSDKESQDSESLDTEYFLDSGTQLCKLMKICKDPVEFRAGLTNTQINLLQEHSSKKRDQLIEKLQQKVQELVKKRGLHVNRNVVPLLKMRVADSNTRMNDICKAMITIWRSNESLLDLIKEGTWIEIFNIVPTSVRYSEIQLSAGRQSIFKKSTLKENNNINSKIQTLERKPYTIKDLQSTITTDYNEIDTFGFIFLIEPSTKEYESSKQLFQNVYISDEYKNIIAINYWGGIKKFGFENILDTGQIISCVNLQRRHGNINKCLPQFRATEFTYFTKTCKIDMLRIMTEEFSRKLAGFNRKQFIEECLQVKNNCANMKHGNTDFSPYRLNNSEFNITKNKIFIDSPVNKCVDANLTGLDFESSFIDADKKELSPKSLKRKRKVNEKIAKLEMYGEPPPLQPIHILNKSNIINNSYKSPLLINNKDNIKSAASEKKLPENLSSSVCLNRTYVKNINPVKLNFSNNYESEDPFAEEFDASPPLSLE